MATWEPAQLRDDLARIAGRALAPGPYLRDAEARLRRAVQMDGLCWYSLDPTTALMTGHWRSGLPERLPELTHNEYVEDDVSKYAELARRRRPVAVLSRATRGNLERSPRFTSIMKPAGLAHELRAVFVAGGQPWGAAYLLRHAGRPDFTDRDVAALAASASVLARGFRSILVAEQAEVIDGGHADTLPLTIPGVLVLGPDGDVEVVTDEARAALTALGASRSTVLPQAVRAVAEAARSTGGSASVHARAADGRWLTIQAAPSNGPTSGRVAVTLMSARAAETAPLRLRAYGLTAREQEIVQQIAEGLTSPAIAAKLHISPHTVQDHLKAVFDKTGSRSRRELTARLFVSEYAPRLHSTAL